MDGLTFARRILRVDKPRSYTLAKILRGTFGRWPLSVENYICEEMKSTLAGIGQAGGADLIHVDAIQMAGYAGTLRRWFPDTPIIYNWHNIESELMERFAANTTSAGKRLYAGITARKLRSLERSILQDAFGHIVCSRRERDQLSKIAPGKRIEVVENGVDAEYFTCLPEAPEKRRRLLFVGSMNYHANIEAAVWFASAAWPRIREKYPLITLTLAGYDPAPAVLALRHVDGIEVTGTVDDIRPYYREAVAAIAPLRTGSGTRLKILEAMAAGAPVISTALGAEGIELEPGRHLLIAGSEEQWLQAVEAVLDEGMRSRLTKNARELVQLRYNWRLLGEKLYRAYTGWLSE